MSLKVSKLKARSAFDTNKVQLWEMIGKDHIFREYFNAAHPIFQYDLIDCSDALNFWVSIKGRPEFGRVCGSAFVHDFRGVYTDEQTEAGFKISFHNVIRNFLLNVIHEDTTQQRWEHEFFNADGFSPNAITDYVRLCTQNLTFVRLQCTELSNVWRWWFSAEGCQDFGFHMPKDYAETVLKSEYAHEANRCTRDHIGSLLVRAFLATIPPGVAQQEAKDSATVNPQTAALMAEIRKSVSHVDQLKKIESKKMTNEQMLESWSLLTSKTNNRGKP